MSQFIITGYPRSRTAWFSAYFTNGDMLCHHEPINFEEAIFRGESISDSSLLMKPESLVGHKVLIILRNKWEALVSMSKIIKPELAQFIIDRCEEGMKHVSGKVIPYNEINERIEEIHEYLGVPFNRERFEIMKGLIIEQDFFHAIKKRDEQRLQ